MSGEDWSAQLILATVDRALTRLKTDRLDYAADYHHRFKAMNLRLEDFGFDPGATDWAEVALRFTLSHEGGHSALIGTTNPHNARRNIEAAAKGPLPANVVQQLRKAFVNARQHSGKPWPALT